MARQPKPVVLTQGKGPPDPIPNTDILMHLLTEVREAHSRILGETKRAHEQVAKEAKSVQEDINCQYESLKQTASKVQGELKSLRDRLGEALQKHAAVEQMLNQCNEIQSKHATSKEQLDTLIRNLQTVQIDLLQIQRSYNTLKESTVSSPNIVPDGKRSPAPVSPIALPAPMPTNIPKQPNEHDLSVDTPIVVKWGEGLITVVQND